MTNPFIRKAGFVMDVAKCIGTGKYDVGRCPVCRKPTIFVHRGLSMRDYYNCIWCRSLPRQRALLSVLNSAFPSWRDLGIHESSPHGAASGALKGQCKNYSTSQFWTDVQPGEYRDGVLCENLEQLTFADNEFDLIITQDVFEHVLHADQGFFEVARTLKPGGAHVFTIPWYKSKPTLVRARKSGENIEYLEPPDYHVNPIDPNGSLVVREWGYDLLEYIQRSSGLETEVYLKIDRRLGLDGDFLEVFISRKKR